MRACAVSRGAGSRKGARDGAPRPFGRASAGSGGPAEQVSGRWAALAHMLLARRRGGARPFGYLDERPLPAASRLRRARRKPRHQDTPRHLPRRPGVRGDAAGIGGAAAPSRAALRGLPEPSRLRGHDAALHRPPARERRDERGRGVRGQLSLRGVGRRGAGEREPAAAPGPGVASRGDDRAQRRDRSRRDAAAGAPRPARAGRRLHYGQARRFPRLRALRPSPDRRDDHPDGTVPRPRDAPLPDADGRAAARLLGGPHCVRGAHGDRRGRGKPRGAWRDLAASRGGRAPARCQDGSIAAAAAPSPRSGSGS